MARQKAHKRSFSRDFQDINTLLPALELWIEEDSTILVAYRKNLVVPLL